MDNDSHQQRHLLGGTHYAVRTNTVRPFTVPTHANTHTHTMYGQLSHGIYNQEPESIDEAAALDFLASFLLAIVSSVVAAVVVVFA